MDFIFECWNDIPRVSTANEWDIFSTREQKFISPSDHAVFYLLYNRVKNIFKKILKADWMRVISHMCDINDIYTIRIGFLSSWYHSVSHHMLYNKKKFSVSQFFVVSLSPAVIIAIHYWHFPYFWNSFIHKQFITVIPVVRFRCKYQRCNLIGRCSNFRSKSFSL